jgi:hypothetical protein
MNGSPRERKKSRTMEICMGMSIALFVSVIHYELLFSLLFPTNINN